MSFTSQQKQQLKLHAASEILHGHNTAWSSLRTSYTTHYEPVFAAHLCASLSRLATPWGVALQQIDPTASLSISSIFTHQRPYVTFNSNGSAQQCELADVMVALIDRTNPSNTLSRCIFVQAKRSDCPTITLIESNDLIQLHLYTNRPAFGVKRKNSPQNISFPNALPDTALNYGITPPKYIQATAAPSAWGTDRWRLANALNGYANATVTASVPLQDLLVDLLEGGAGYNFELSSPGDSWTVLYQAGNKWSALINFILQDALAAKSPRYARSFWPRRFGGEVLVALEELDAGWFPTLMVNSHLSPLARSNPAEFAPALISRIVGASPSSQEPPNNDPPSDDGEQVEDGDERWGGMSVVVMEVSARRQES